MGYDIFGIVTYVSHNIIHIHGLRGYVSVGDMVSVATRENRLVRGEIISISEEKAIGMLLQKGDGIVIGSKAYIHLSLPVYPCEQWLGRVVDYQGNAIDGKGALSKSKPYIQETHLNSCLRKKVSLRIDCGIKAFNTFLPLCFGQRIGIFAGSGVGKTSLMSMIVNNISCDVRVVGLIGERGREVNEFLDHLSDSGKSKTVLVVATSDEPAVAKKNAAYLTLSIAEFFRDQGKEVLCVIDSITRFAMAQREISLAVGEIPSVRGYTSSVFSELPKLLERAGPGINSSITGVFTVLVDGDDHNEPISDAIRGIIDGHVVLDRNITAKRYPAINILQSISRTLEKCTSREESTLIKEAKRILFEYQEIEDLFKIGAYKIGTDPHTDRVIDCNNKLEQFLAQHLDECFSIEQSFDILSSCI